MSDRLPSAPALSGLAQIGKHFQLVSVVPAAVVVLSTAALLASGAPAERPTWTKIAEAASDIGLSEAGALAFLVIVLGMALHPFRFAATQVLEGYWGPRPIARVAMGTRARLHLERRRRHLLAAEVATEQAEEVAQRASTSGDLVLRYEAEAHEVALRLAAGEADTAASRYPNDRDRVMPTRLGNILRRHEDLAGRPYGLEATAVVPHLMDIADPEQVAHVDDARTEMDLAVGFVVSWLIVALVGFVLLWPYGPWLALPIIAYGLAWLSYRATVHAAIEYGVALYVLLDLNHAALLERFKVPDAPQDPLERARNISDTALRRCREPGNEQDLVHGNDQAMP